MSRELRLGTPYGEARLVTDRAPHEEAVLLLGHGAGNGIDTPDLEALARDLPGNGVTVVRLEQPWRVAGRRIATAPPTLDVALRAAVASLSCDVPLVVGGRSAGARSAARCAREVGAAGCLALAFPLHPPGRPEKSRLHELQGSGIPTLVIQGERDRMGRPEEFPGDLDLGVVPGADHSFTVLASGSVTQDDAMAIVVETTLEWLVREVTGNQGRADDVALV